MVTADEEKGLVLSPYEEIVIDEDGRELIRAVFPLPPPDIKVEAAFIPEMHITF